MRRKTRKNEHKHHCRCRAIWNFAKRAAYMLAVLFVAALLISSFGGESFKMMDFVKEAASTLAEAAGEAFGEGG